MPGRVIEVLSVGTRLSVERGFLLIKQNDDTHKVPLSDISSLVVGKGITLSTNLLLALQESSANLVVTGSSYHPASFFWSLDPHGEHCTRLSAQINMTQPLKKRLWKQVVQSKIQQQSAVLQLHHNKKEGLDALAQRVRSGDPDNLEAQAARRYWQTLFSRDFRRNSNAEEGDNLNILLNYGYAIMRAAMARSISAYGLHPALGVHHINKRNMFCLVDDL